MNDYFISREACPCCLSQNSVTLYKAEYAEPKIREYLKSHYSFRTGAGYEYLENAYYILNECKDCGLVYQREIPNEHLMYKLYEEWIDPQQTLEGHKNKNTEYFVHKAKQIIDLIEYFGIMPGKLKFLDFGMGWGSWCRLAKGFGCEVYGAELSNARIDYAQASGIQIVKWEEMPNYQFDFINTEQVFEHIPAPFETLKYLKLSLKSNGIIKVSVPDGWDMKRRLKIEDWTAFKGSQNSLNPVAPLEHINCFTHDTLVRMARKAGLNLIVIPESRMMSLKKNAALMSSKISPKEKIKSVVKPYYYSFIGHKSTRLFFINSDHPASY